MPLKKSLVNVSWEVVVGGILVNESWSIILLQIATARSRRFLPTPFNGMQTQVGSFSRWPYSVPPDALTLATAECTRSRWPIQGSPLDLPNTYEITTRIVLPDQVINDKLDSHLGNFKFRIVRALSEMNTLSLWRHSISSSDFVSKSTLFNATIATVALNRVACGGR